MREPFAPLVWLRLICQPRLLLGPGGLGRACPSAWQSLGKTSHARLHAEPQVRRSLRAAGADGAVKATGQGRVDVGLLWPLWSQNLSRGGTYGTSHLGTADLWGCATPGGVLTVAPGVCPADARITSCPQPLEPRASPDMVRCPPGSKAVPGWEPGGSASGLSIRARRNEVLGHGAVGASEMQIFTSHPDLPYRKFWLWDSGVYSQQAFQVILTCEKLEK